MMEVTRDSSVMQGAQARSRNRPSASSTNDSIGLLSSSMHPDDRHELCSTWSTEAELAPTSSALALAMQQLSMREVDHPEDDFEGRELASGKGKERAISLNDDEEDHYPVQTDEREAGGGSHATFGSAAIPIAFSRPVSTPYSTSHSRPYSVSYSFASGSSSSPRTPASFNFSPTWNGMYATTRFSETIGNDDSPVTPATSYASSYDKGKALEENVELLHRSPEGTTSSAFGGIALQPPVLQAQQTQSSVSTPVSSENPETVCTISTIVDDNNTNEHHNIDNIDNTPDSISNTIVDISADEAHDNDVNPAPGAVNLSTELSHRSSLPLLVPLPPSPTSPRSDLPHVHTSTQSSRAPSRSPASRPRSLSSISFAFSISSNTSASSKSSLSKMKSKLEKGKLGLKGLLGGKNSKLDSEPVASGSGSASDNVLSPISHLNMTPAPPAMVIAEASTSAPVSRQNKGKMRAFSSPLPYVISSPPPVSPTITFGLSPSDTPLPIADASDYMMEDTLVEPEVPANLFEEMLPRELQLECIRSLIWVCEEEHKRELAEGRWTVFRASQERWVGAAKGFREIIKLSRVSHAWRSLAFDGQIWSSIDLSAYPQISRSSAQQLISSASPFVKHASINGLPRLFPILAKGLAAPYAVVTQLRSLNLRGCRHISTGPLHLLISVSPLLENVNFSASSAVTNYTMNLLATHCPALKVVNISRCPYLSGSGIIALGSIAAGPLVGGKPLKHSKIRELRIAGLRYANTDVLTSIGRHMPDLEVLDMSGSRLLTDNAIEAFVFCTKESDCDKIALTSREAGRDPAEMTTHYRRLTKLRHLNLSSCPEITDRSCANLAHAVPNLEFLELADLGGAMKDDGLVHLLSTLPRIRKVDLDDAMDITDRVIDALTPSPVDSRTHRSAAVREPGDMLEHLILSYATNISNEAMLRLIRACPKLRILEMDNTRISDSVLREFVRTLRRRKMTGAEVVAVDCRSVSKAVVSELATSTRPRRGWKAWEAQAMGYDDGSPHTDSHTAGPSLTAAQDECDESKIVLKSFWSWQAVDTAAALRERRRRIVGSRRLTEGDLNLSRIVARGGLDPDLVREDQLEGDGDDMGGNAGEPRRRGRWVIRWSGGRGGNGGSMYLGMEPATTAAGSNNTSHGEERSCVIM